MDDSVYRAMAYDQDHHWWFKGRKIIIKKLLLRFVNDGASILEVGCGTGGNLKILRERGSVVAMESHADSVRMVSEVFGSDVKLHHGWLPDKFHIDQNFDSICCFDVLEHIEEDEKSLVVMKNHLRDGGKILITVPCWQFLYSKRDELLGHYRRYSLREIRQKAHKAGLKVAYANYFMTFLFPVALMSRLIERKGNKESVSLHDYKMNALLFFVFRFEAIFFNWFKMPFGLSLAVVLEREK